MTKDELLKRIDEAIEMEDKFVSRFLEMFQSKIIERADLEDSKKEEINKLFHHLDKDSQEHQKAFENIKQLVMAADKEEF